MNQPTLTREGLALALFSLVQALPGLLTCSRTLKHWTDVDGTEQPAAFLAAGKKTPQQDPDGLPTRWEEQFDLYLYNWSEDPTVPPSTGINNLLDAFEALLKPVTFGQPGLPGSLQVLGDKTGRIRHAWISGAIETDEGVLGPQAFAIVPISIEFHR